MKWLNRLFAWTNKSEELIFASGIGNSRARTKVGNETQMIGENDNLRSRPSVLAAEFLEFEYPLTLEQYRAILENPYDVIMVDGKEYYIRKLIFKRRSRIGYFKLIPKNRQ